MSCRACNMHARVKCMQCGIRSHTERSKVVIGRCPAGQIRSRGKPLQNEGAHCGEVLGSHQHGLQLRDALAVCGRPRRDHCGPSFLETVINANGIPAQRQQTN